MLDNVEAHMTEMQANAILQAQTQNLDFMQRMAQRLQTGGGQASDAELRRLGGLENDYGPRTSKLFQRKQVAQNPAHFAALLERIQLNAGTGQLENIESDGRPSDAELGTSGPPPPGPGS